MIRNVHIAWFLLLCLFDLQASVVTYTITSRTSVRADGMEPVGSYAQYEQSSTGGRIGQMTAGNYTSLTLYGYSGKRIRTVTLEMRSNASAGAGTLEMLQGDSCVWSIPADHFSSDAWNGAYSTAYVPVTNMFCPGLSVVQGDVLYINVDALVSSLYIQSYTIEYFDEWDAPFVVDFHTGTAMVLPSSKETEVGEGILLPDCPYEDSVWHFMGWTEIPVEQTERQPMFWRAGRMYYPYADTRLYALYTDGGQVAEGLLQDTLFETGTYVIADAVWKCMAAGGLNRDKKLPTLPLPLSLKNADSLYVLQDIEVSPACLYYIDFFTDSLALIRSVLTGNYIAPSANGVLALQNVERAWQWRRQTDNTVRFLYRYDNGTRELRANCGTTLATVDSVWFANNIFLSGERGNLLFRCGDDDMKPIVSYTSFPLGNTALLEQQGAVWRREGNHIINPSCTMLCLYSINGTLLTATTTDIDLSSLALGVYLVVGAGRCCTIFR